VSTSSLSFCMVTTFYPPHNFGGDGIYVHRLSNELARRGHRVTVVSAPDAFAFLGGKAGMSPPQHENVILEPLEPRLGRLGPLVTYLSGRPGLRARQLDELFAREQFDVVHFHNVSLVGGPGVLAYGDGVKLYTTHEHWLVCPMHTLWRNNREPCPEPKCLRCTLAFRRPPQLWRYVSSLERRTSHVDLFLSPSRFTIDKHRERGFAGPMRHLPYFTPPDDEEALSPRETPPRPYFLVVGRLERLKGVHTLIELFRRYDSADLVVVGTGTAADELQKQAAGLEHVRFTGALPFDTLRTLYKDAIAVLAPSVGYETFGMMTIEAFARRTPAIVRDLGGLPEPVRESGAGFVYRDDAELLEAMEALRTDTALRTELGRRGHLAYLERWAPEPHLRAYFDLIEQASDRRTARLRTRSHTEGRT
jgi:glycosyltransferase involved in cell wall biosynthesis